ncbi:DUF6804 family protein [Porphyromonas endodontalis]|uniref:DUF6804 family protein n=1 Tax=Porphyromonas endodontalis TaxID=28124 RepID=UPI0023F0265F|nr:DUF6804 family protein [Porphyromonas endodontalis]
MKYLYIILSALLLLCLAHMPYGYYQLIRIVAMFGFGIIAYHYYDREQNGLGIVFVVLALLFQPILKINLGRELWHMIDVIVAIFLIVLCIMEFYQTNHHEKE